VTRHRRIKVLTLRAAERAGLFSRIGESRWRRDRLLILCYHGVALADEDQWSDVHISESRLRHRFEMLRAERCSLLSLDDALERLSAGDLPPRSVTVTFDEGLYDFYAKAYPLISEFEIPTTLYVPTYYATRQKPIFDLACSYLLWRGRGKIVESETLLPQQRRYEIPVAAAPRYDLHLAIRAHANSAGYTAMEKNGMLAELARQIGLDWDAFVSSRMLQLMSPDEFNALDRRLVSVQLHSHRHRTPRSEPLFMREIDDNIDALAALGFPRAGRRHFCYPSGDADPVFYPWLEARGIVSATTCEPRLATRDTHPLDLPRVIDTMAMTDVEFRAWTAGVSAFIPRRRFRMADSERLEWDGPRESARRAEPEASAGPPARASVTD
jgi:peptidoglycan/xylan/chitin deacetylase (PgdA/CDA1 family)